MPFADQGGGPLARKVYSITGGAPAVQVIPDNRQRPPRIGFILQNPSTIDVFWGESADITNTGSTRGFRLAGNPDATKNPDSTVTDTTINSGIWAYAASDATLVVGGIGCTPP